MISDFTWVDGERLIRFGEGTLGEAPALLAGRGLGDYALLTTERAEQASPTLVAGAAEVLHVPSGSVPEAAAAIRPGVQGRPVVALGGGRVVDAAKAIAAADGLDCAAVPTTLAGSPMTPFHRMLEGVSEPRMARPSLVVWDPVLVATLPRRQLVATAMNALAHALESLYGPLANPVAELAALRAAELVQRSLPRESPEPDALALAALLAGYAVGTAGFAVHHALCQTIVRTCGTPHAETNAIVLPHSAAFVASRAPGPLGRFAAALGDPSGDPLEASARISALAAETGVGGLSELGVDADSLVEIAAAAGTHPAMPSTPGGSPSEAELVELLRAAL